MKPFGLKSEELSRLHPRTVEDLNNAWAEVQELLDMYQHVRVVTMSDVLKGKLLRHLKQQIKQIYDLHNMGEPAIY